MDTCTRRIQFCAGHRVLRHEGKCANFHGHNYVALFHAQGPLDEVGRIIDFGVLKERLGGWIDANWDHGFLASKDDREAISLIGAPVGQKLYVMPENPTAENMASFLGEVVCPVELAGTGVKVVEIELWETENCKATWRSIR